MTSILVFGNLMQRAYPEFVQRVMDLATAFHAFYHDVGVMPHRKGKREFEVSPELSRARLKLVAAARIALARTLHLMGMTAPERFYRDGVEQDDDEDDE